MAQEEEFPAYLDEMELGDERRVRERMDQLEAELQQLGKQLEESRRSKRVLHVDGDDLTAEVARFLTEELRVPAREDGRPSGLRLGDGGEDWCFGGVMSAASGNVTKSHVARMVLDREGEGLPEDAPTVLVANTFRAGQTLEERDQPVPDDVVKRAAEDHVVVIRTVDLLRLGMRAANGYPAAEQLTEAVRGGGGWFEVDRSLTAQLHPAPSTGTKPAPSSAAA